VRDFPNLRTRRLVLREINGADADDLFQIHGNAEHMKWFGSDPLPDIGAANRLIELFAKWREEPATGTRWGIHLQDAPGLIGTCGLFRWNRNWRTCVVGYEISPLQQGRGLMQEALAAMFAWGFEHMQLNRIEAHVHPENPGSLAILRKFGFVEEARLREVGHWAGCHHDLMLYSLLKRDWIANHESH
jgi:ribosomal-protein-alanine N-acetyltransferase